MEKAKQDPQAGAIGSHLASQIYDVPIVATDIQNNRQNWTRFYALREENWPSSGRIASKATIVFTLPHKSGALSQILSIIGSAGYNLTYIVSRPLTSTPWEYVFSIEIEIQPEADLSEVIAKISKHTIRLKMLGSYDTTNIAD